MWFFFDTPRWLSFHVGPSSAFSFCLKGGRWGARDLWRLSFESIFMSCWETHIPLWGWSEGGRNENVL